VKLFDFLKFESCFFCTLMSMLFLEAVTARHMGNYSCIAENSAGIAEQFSEHRVNGFLKAQTFFVSFFCCSFQFSLSI
jgi:hypothetical protein